MEAAARRLMPASGFPFPGLLRRQAESTLEGLDTKEAFKVRDLTHFALWVSCCVSLGFVVLWFFDVLKLECLKHPWVADVPGVWRCLFELLGVFVFLTSFQDSLRIVLTYDGQHQELLQRKQKVLDEVSTGCSEVLERAQVNAEQLRGILVDNQIRRVRAHIRDVRANLVPTLVHVSQELSGEEQQAFEQAAGRLIMQMVENLQEPGQLAVSLVGNLTEVYGSMKALRNEEDPPIAPPTNELSEAQLAQLFPELARVVQTARANQPKSPRPSISEEPETFFQHWWVRTMGLVSTLRGELQNGQLATQHHRDHALQAAIKNAKKDVVDHILGPVLAVLEIPELCRRWASEEDAQKNLKAEASTHSSWLGCGRPPWEYEGSCWAVQCFMPRLVAPCAWGAAAVAGDDFVQQGTRYPKKWCFFGLWVEVRTQLHERLLFALCATMVYSVCYMLLAHQEVVEGCRGHGFWGCTWEICQSCTSLLALMCNIPAILICLSHMRRIDAMMDCESTIRKLEEIRRVVHTFDQRTRTEEQRRVLLEAVDRRVMRRIDIVDRFRSYINRRDVSSEQIAEATERLDLCLRGAAQCLGPATQWLELPPNWRERQAEEFEGAAQALCAEFDSAKPDEPMLPDAPQLALRVFAQAQPGTGTDAVPLEKTSLRKALSCMRRCRQRRPKQCPPELLQVKGAASYVLVFPAVQWLQVSSNQQEASSQPIPQQVQREDSSETIVGIHEAKPAKTEAQGTPAEEDVWALPQAQNIVSSVCHAPRVFEKLNESGAYLHKAYKSLLPRQATVPAKRLQQHVLELVLLYLRYCGCKIKLARTVDGDQLMVSIRMREEVAKCHASDLGYALRVSRHLSKLFGLANGSADETVSTYHPYSAHLEECFKDQFGPGRLDLLLKIAMDAPEEYIEEDRSQRAESESDNDSVQEVVTSPPPVKRAPFPALLLVTMEHQGVASTSAVDGFYKARKETGEDWPESWMKEGPPIGETPSYHLVPGPGEAPSEAAVSFVESTQLWTHAGKDGAVAFVCPGKKRTDVPTEGWIRPSSRQGVDEHPAIPSYYFDNGPFQAYFGRLTEGSIFRSVDQARLVDILLKEVFNLDEMQKHGFLTCHFVPHHSATLRFFKEHITSWWFPWHAQWPLEYIRDYFGEKVAFEHDFLGFLAGMAVPIGILSAVQCFVPFHLHSRTAFGAFVVIWAAALSSGWRRREFQHVVDWGMEQCEKNQSPDCSKEDTRNEFSIGRLMRFCTFDVPTLLAAWIICFQWFLHLLHASLVDGEHIYAVQITAFVNALQMLFVDALCKAALPRLVKLEDKSNSKDFEAALARRIFFYRCIVGYSSMVLGCVLRPLAGMCAAEGGCDRRLADELEVIFGVRLLASFLHNAVIMHRAKMSFHKSGPNSGYEQMGQAEAWQPKSYLEAQADMLPRDILEATCEQMEVLVQLGYVICFGVLRPRIGIFFFIITLFRVRANAWGLLRDSRRPFPETSDGLGVRNELLSSLIEFSVLSISILLTLINGDARFVHSHETGLQPYRCLEPYMVAPSGSMDPVRLILMAIVVKYLLTLLQSVVRQLLPRESAKAAIVGKRRGLLLKQLRDSLLGVKEELCETQNSDEDARQPERLIRDWIAGAQQLDMDDEDFEPAAAAKQEKDSSITVQASA